MREGDEKKMTDKDDEFLKMGFGKRKERFDLDLNLPFEESFFGLGFQNSASEEAGFECFDRLVAYGDDNGRGSSSGGGVELSKRRRFSTEEKAKGKIDDDGTVNNNRNLDLNLSLGLFGRDPVEESFEILNLVDKLSSNSAGPSVENELQRNELDDDAPVHAVESTQHAVARSFAEKFAQPEKHREQQGTKRILSCEDDKEVKDSQSPFALAMEVIENRNASQKVLRKSSSGLSESLFKWVPAERTECSGSYHRSAPTLMDLSLNVLARNAHKIVSLENVPDELRHKLSKMVSNCRNMDAHFVELLTRDSPTEIRVWDTSQLTEDECSKILYACDTRNLTVLQYDLCGLCMPEYVLRRILAGPLCRLHKLAILSLKGAHRLSDAGLSALAKSAPALLSINLSQCSLLTSDGINHLASHLEHNLRELYLDDCQSINVMLILPALKKFKHLEVLSVAGIQTVRDDFVIEMVEACGMSMKELVLANCL